MNCKDLNERAIHVAKIKAHIWGKHFLNSLRYVGFSNGKVSVIGMKLNGKIISVDFPEEYLSLPDKKIQTMEQMKYLASLDINSQHNNGMYIELK